MEETTKHRCPACGQEFDDSIPSNETIVLTPASDNTSIITPKTTSNPASSRSIKTSEKEYPVIDRMGDYDLIEEVARGGMGVVYRAWQQTLKRIVAIKVLRNANEATAEDLERFIREAKSAAKLTHPNIVPIYDMSVSRGKPFFAMQFIKGRALDRVIDENPMSPREAVRIIGDVARAVAYAHSQGVIHRDLKPGNIIIDEDGAPMVTDFGLAAQINDEKQQQTRMTQDGSVMGTIPYIPPEQAAGKVGEIGARSDVYSLGAVLYEMLTGKAPFEGETQFEILRRVIHQDPIPPRKLNPRIHPDAETICLKCLEKDPARRYSSAESLAADCEAMLHGEVIQAAPASQFYRLRRYVYRHALLVVLTTVIFFLIAVALIYSRLLEKKKQEAKDVSQKLSTTVNELDESKAAQRTTLAQMERSWRVDYSTDFTRTDSQLSLNPNATRFISSAALEIRPLTDANNLRAPLGLNRTLPTDFRLRMSFELDTDSRASELIFYVRLNQEFIPTSSTLTLYLSSNAARLMQGELLMAETPRFTLTPNKRIIVELQRLNNKFSVYINDRLEVKSDDVADQLLFDQEIQLPTISSPQHQFFGMRVAGGKVNLESLQLSIQGLSSITAKLAVDLANQLMLNEVAERAIPIYEMVLIEPSDPSLHIQALRGYAQAITRVRNESSLVLSRKCEVLLKRANKTRYVPPGELDFLKGLTFAAQQNHYNSNQTNNRQRAVSSFRKAYEDASNLTSDGFVVNPILVAGPFPFNEYEPFNLRRLPENAFDENAVFSAVTGPKKTWFIPGDGQVEGLRQLISSHTQPAVWYIRESISVSGARDIMVDINCTGPSSLWLNSRMIYEDAGEIRARHNHVRRSEKIRLDSGSNNILLKAGTIPLQAASFSFRPVDDMRIDLLSIMEEWGQLLGLNVERAMALYHEKNAFDIFRQLAAMYSTEARGTETLLLGLEQIDNLIRHDTAEKSRAPNTTVDTPDSPAAESALTEKKLSTAFDLVNALLTLYPDGGQDLALRAHRLGREFAQTKSYTIAAELLKAAVEQAPSWYLPRYEGCLLLYHMGEINAGRNALIAAMRDLPESIELRLAISEFALDDNNGTRLVDAQLARMAAEDAVQLTDRKNAPALELLAKALYSQRYFNDALTAITDAERLESTPERLELKNKINEEVSSLRLFPPAPPTVFTPRR